MAATVAVKIIGPMPGTVMTLIAVLFGSANLFDFCRDFVDPVIHPHSVAVKTNQDRAHAWRYLVFVLFQGRLERVLQRA